MVTAQNTECTLFTYAPAMLQKFCQSMGYWAPTYTNVYVVNASVFIVVASYFWLTIKVLLEKIVLQSRKFFI